MPAERRFGPLWLSFAVAVAACVTLGCPADGDDEGGGDGGGSTDTSGGPVEASTGTDEADGSSSGTADDTGPVDGSSSSSGSTGEPLDCGATLFVNFDGAVLTVGPDDAPNDVSELQPLGELGPYEGAADADEVLAIIREHLAPFDVCATRVRPDQGPYTMIVVTSDDTPVPTLFATGPLDCGNANPNNVGVVWAGDPVLMGARAIANAVSGTFGATVGLETQSVDDSDLMCRLGCSVDVDRSFADACLALPSRAECSEHARHCAEGEQNAYQEMLARFGPAQ